MGSNQNSIVSIENVKEDIQEEILNRIHAFSIESKKCEDNLVAKVEYINNEWKFKENNILPNDRIAEPNILIKNKVNDRIVIILESPHKDEYSKQITAPAMGTTGENINKYLLDILNKKIGNPQGDKKEYQKGEIIKSIKGYVICQNENIFAINTKTDEIVNLKEKANVIDVIDNVIYYSDDTESNTLKIGTIKDNKDNGTIATFLRKDLFKESTDQPMEIVEFGEDDGKIKCYIGYRDGTAHMLQDEYCFTMNKDGSNLQKESVQNLENENDQKLKGVYINSKSVNGKIVNDLVYVDESTKERKTILTQKEINEKFEFTSDDEHTINLAESAIIGNEIYVTLDYGVHYSQEDMGWRYAYKRQKTVCFKYNTDTKEITELYKF